MNLSYMDFYQEQESAPRTKAKQVKMASTGQIKYYNDLCKQRRMKPEEVSKLTFAELSKELKRLESFFPASLEQVDLIERKVVVLEKSLAQLNFTEEQIQRFEVEKENISHRIVSSILRDTLDLEDIISKLTGGMKGSASTLIGQLIKAEKYFEELQPITEAQIKTIVSMFFCPDVNFEQYQIPRRVDIDVEQGLWRKPTPEEFAENVSLTFNKKSASDFINSSSVAFYNWKKTRIRPGQLEYIMQLESQLANDSKLRKIKLANDIDGQQVEVGTTDNVQVKGEAYVQHTQEQLVQLSVEQASKFIAQLKSEVADKDPSFIEDSEETLERVPNSIESAMNEEHELLNAMMYRLQAMAGYEDEDLVECATYALANDPKSSPYEANYIREFISDMIKHEAVDYSTVLELADECKALQEILLDM